MPLFCKQCGDRRTPIFDKEENISIWLCESCRNFVDVDDTIIREQTESEREEAEKKMDEFEKSMPSFSNEKRARRKGVN